MTSFKCCILIVMFVLSIFVVNDCKADEEQRMFDKVSTEDFNKCLNDAGITKDEIIALRKNPPKEPNTNLLCYLKCMATASGLLDKDGKIVSDLIKENIPPSLSNAAATKVVKCIEAIGNISTCNDMEKIRKCIQP